VNELTVEWFPVSSLNDEHPFAVRGKIGSVGFDRPYHRSELPETLWQAVFDSIGLLK